MELQKVTFKFKVIQGHWYWCNSTGHIQFFVSPDGVTLTHSDYITDRNASVKFYDYETSSLRLRLRHRNVILYRTCLPHKQVSLGVEKSLRCTTELVRVGIAIRERDSQCHYTTTQPFIQHNAMQCNTIQYNNTVSMLPQKTGGPEQC